MYFQSFGPYTILFVSVGNIFHTKISSSHHLSQRLEEYKQCIAQDHHSISLSRLKIHLLIFSVSFFILSIFVLKKKKIFCVVILKIMC